MKKNGMMYRSAPVAAIRADGPSTIDEKTRSVDVVLATEDPVQIFDWDRGLINEILLMSGAQMPSNNQLVMLDAHQRNETGDIIGSVRDIKIDGSQMPGRAFFSTAPEAEGPWVKTKEGHLTDFSIGYRYEDSGRVWIEANQTAVVEGRTFTGPVQVVTKWTPRELSAVPVGADQNAKARSKFTEKQKEENTMDKKLRDFLVSRGLPETATEDEAYAFMATLEVKRAEDPPSNLPDLDKVRAEATGKERDRIREIDALLTRYKCQDMARDMIVGAKTLDEAQRAVMDRIHEKAENPGYGGVAIGLDEKDKFRVAAEDSLILRAGMEVKTPAPGATELRGYSLVELARECLRTTGQNHRGGAMEMVGRAMTSSDFPYILANLATKSMQQAWDQAQETWNIWCGIGSVADFKTYYDQALSEHDDLEEVPNSGEINYGKFTEKVPETYKAVSYAKKFRITRVMIINDDMNALTQMPAKRAEAAARKVGDVAYAILTGNGNMADGSAIFCSGHSNLAISGFATAPGVITLAEGIRAMGVQKDIAGKRRLNIRPLFFIAPKALEGNAEVFFKSDKYADYVATVAVEAVAATRANPYSGTYFTRVYEPRLDDASATAWYLAAQKGQTVKVVFLGGKQGPLMEMRQPGFTIEGMEYVVSIDVGAYAVDYRGMYMNDGA